MTKSLIIVLLSETLIVQVSGPYFVTLPTHCTLLQHLFTVCIKISTICWFEQIYRNVRLCKTNGYNVLREVNDWILRWLAVNNERTIASLLRNELYLNYTKTNRPHKTYPSYKCLSRTFEQELRSSPKL